MLSVLLELMWRYLFLTLPIAVLIVAILQTSTLRNLPSLTQLRDLVPLFAKRNLSTTTLTTQTNTKYIMTKTPVYFLSHGGASLPYQTSPSQ